MSGSEGNGGPPRRETVRVEELVSILPDLEELEGLRLGIAAAAVPDPRLGWTKASDFSTIDKRVITLDALDGVLEETHRALQAQVRDAFRTYQQLVRAFWSEQPAEVVAHLVRLAEAEEAEGRHARARQILDAALGVSLPCADRRPQILVLRRIARALRGQGEFREALLFYRRSASLAMDAGDPHGEIVARTGQGTVHGLQERWPQAESCFRGALERLEEVGGDDLLLERGQLCNNLGTVATRLGRLDEADGWFEAALEVWERVDAPDDHAICLHNLGLLRDEQGRGEEAREVYARALDLSASPALRAAVYNDLAQSYAADGLLQEAAESGRRAEQHALAARSPFYLAHMYCGLGNVARAHGADDGFIFYEKALQIARDKGYAMLEAKTLVDYARLRRETDGGDEARAYLERAREIFAANGAERELERVDALLAGDVAGPPRG